MGLNLSRYILHVLVTCMTVTSAQIARSETFAINVRAKSLHQVSSCMQEPTTHVPADGSYCSTRTPADAAGVADSVLQGACGCLAPLSEPSTTLNSGIVRKLCQRLGNHDVNHGTRTMLVQRPDEVPKRRGEDGTDLLPFLATMECWQDHQAPTMTCRALFGKQGLAFRQKIRQLGHDNIVFSHCALSFGDQPPLQSTTCFVGNATDAEPQPAVLATLVSFADISSTPDLKFAAVFDDNYEFCVQTLIFDLHKDAAFIDEEESSA